MAKLKMPTGDPNMPHHIRVAKRAYYVIVKGSDGSTGSPVRDLFVEHEKRERKRGLKVILRTKIQRRRMVMVEVILV